MRAREGACISMRPSERVSITKSSKKSGRKEVVEVIWSRREAQTVDALAVRGDEGRGILRKALVSWKRA